jgi:hypothetical protein
MPGVVSLVDQSVKFDMRSRSQMKRRLARRVTFNSLQMWIAVVMTWVVAGPLLLLTPSAALAVRMARVW